MAAGAPFWRPAFPHVGIGLVGVSLAFGLTIVAMAYAIGDVSGCHLNPAVTFGLVLGGRHPAKEMLPYWIVQVLGGIVAAWVLVFIAGGNGSDPLAGGLAANGFAGRSSSPGHYSYGGGLGLARSHHDRDIFLCSSSWEPRTRRRRSVLRRWPLGLR